MIQSLTEFAVSIDYGRNHTTYLIGVDGTQVAKLHKDVAHNGRSPYQAFSGPQLDRFEGWVNHFQAMTPDRRIIGTIDHRNRSFRPAEWRFEQAGLAPLSGEPAGLANKARRTLPVLDWGVVDAALTFKMRYRSAESEGFEFTRHAGIRATYTVKIHDPRLDRLLVLAALVYFNSNDTSDPRADIAGLTANPFKD
ncbi:hypothetical protein [Kitasatospora sp. McL0602]|uniref:hypothetical protein n=1 Tax=Kitasatospora sp. McL0602 TaxID=3439530 RepID=UPI003F8BC229